MTRLSLVLTCALALCASAQTKPDLNGTWKMNPSKSKFGGQGGPDAITIKFDQQEPNLSESLTIVNPQGERTLNLKYTTDGKESVSQIDGNEVKTTAKWEGETLVIELRGSDNLFRRKFTLSDGGKTMMMAVHIAGQGGEQDDTVVLEKQ
jgi:hypothetical protein